MNKTITVLLLLLLCTGCVGPVGPRGPQGPTGPVGQGFEVTVNFGPANNYSQLITFPPSITVLNTDIVVVYLLYSVEPQTGQAVWQPLPASFFFNDGTELVYGFDHTASDVQLYLGGNTNFSLLGPDFTQNQTFRIAILPVDYVQANHINLNDMQVVTQAVRRNNFEKLNVTRP